MQRNPYPGGRLPRPTLGGLKTYLVSGDWIDPKTGQSRVLVQSHSTLRQGGRTAPMRRLGTFLNAMRGKRSHRTTEFYLRIVSDRLWQRPEGARRAKWFPKLGKAGEFKWLAMDRPLKK